MRASHTSRQEVVMMVHDTLGAEKALDVGQRHLKIKKRTMLTWFDQAKAGKVPAFKRRQATRRRARRA